MESVSQPLQNTMEQSAIPQVRANSIVEDLQSKLVDIEIDKTNIENRQAEEREQMILRHEEEIAIINNRRQLIADTLGGLRKIYSTQHEDTVPTHRTEIKPESDGILNADDKIDIDGDKVDDEEQEGEEEQSDEATSDGKSAIDSNDSRRRLPGRLLNICIGAIQELNTPSSADDVINYIHVHYPGEVPVKKDIRTSLKDSRRAGRIIAFMTYEGNTPTYLNCLPEFFDDVASRTLKPEYQEKMLERMIELGLSWSQEVSNGVTHSRTPRDYTNKSKVESNGLTARFWKDPKFNWRTFIPEHIREFGSPMSLEDFNKFAESQYQDLSEAEKSTLRSTFSGTLSILRGKGQLFSFVFPGKHGAFYGVDSFFSDPEGGVLKHEYLEKLSDRLNLPTPIV